MRSPTRPQAPAGGRAQRAASDHPVQRPAPRSSTRPPAWCPLAQRSSSWVVWRPSKPVWPPTLRNSATTSCACPVRRGSRRRWRSPRTLGNPDELLITTGFDFPDALSAGAAAANARGAVLLTTAEEPTSSLDDYPAARSRARPSTASAAPPPAPTPTPPWCSDHHERRPPSLSPRVSSPTPSPSGSPTAATSPTRSPVAPTSAAWAARC